MSDLEALGFGAACGSVLEELVPWGATEESLACVPVNCCV